MSRNILIGIIVIVLLIVGGVYLLNRNSTINPSTTNTSPTIIEQPATTPGTMTPTISQTQTSKIVIKNFAFTPASVKVKVGTVVEWTNNDSTPHTITSNDGTFASQPVQPGETYSYTFDEVGTFPYHCSIHPSMIGEIVSEK